MSAADVAQVPPSTGGPLHIVMFGDQHAFSAGGAQVAMSLQKKYLQRAGHTVTMVGPRRDARSAVGEVHEEFIDLPAFAVPPDREYSALWPGARADLAVDRGLARRIAWGAPLPDVVHVQADYWGAFLGYRLAERLRVPVVHTMHNRVDAGIEATLPAPALVLRALNAWRRSQLPGSGPGSDGWAYLRGLARGASAVTAPSAHFARRLEEHGVFSPVDVVWNGIDDDVLGDIEPAPRRDGVSLVWVGRMSPEKRLLPFLHAFADSGVTARLEIIGAGFEWDAAGRVVAERDLGDHVSFRGRLPYRETLERIAAADALVQTSTGFETQGMTPFEAAQLGTPAIVSDPDIADEMGDGVWRVGDSLAETLREADADIRAGRIPVPSERVRREFRQSSRTEAMLAVYRRVLG
ncbi:glycosyltransferase [Microbacterium amylolyticum]|uniref:D-inositol 3-phosphate glycosyltransferase n=1 Tax=Microbacterium amylolyticum TaxID=936337 RepID=A0ABS4ZHP4_9MICO|nr:glycosyltransferase [Microbacterium amylolyticum]MBP2436796.1 glycosyltransferase involved in cell wall biosynthesis [Microbacterium amylolyticum]